MLRALDPLSRDSQLHRRVVKDALVSINDRDLGVILAGQSDVHAFHPGGVLHRPWVIHDALGAPRGTFCNHRVLLLLDQVLPVQVHAVEEGGIGFE